MIINRQDIMELVTDDRVSSILTEIRTSFGEEIQTTQSLEQSFLKIKTQLETFLQELLYKNQQYQNAYHSYIQTDTKYQAIKQIQQQKFGQELITLLEQGYILLQGIREELIGDTIQYKFVKQYSGKTIAYSMNLHQLLQYARQERFSTYTGDIASLAITMKGLIKFLNTEISGEVLTDDPLYNSVMSKMGSVYEHGKLTTNSADTLVEVYYQLKNIGFTHLTGQRLTRGVIYFYKMTQGQIAGYKGNLGQTLGGDSFLDQIKYNARKTTSFNLISVKYLENGLKALIQTFSPPFNKEELLAHLSKQFIQPMGPGIKTDMVDYVQKYGNEINSLISKETAFLRNKVFNLNL